MHGDSNATLDVVMAGWAGGKGCAVVFCTTSSSCSNTLRMRIIFALNVRFTHVVFPIVSEYIYEIGKVDNSDKLA